MKRKEIKYLAVGVGAMLMALGCTNHSGVAGVEEHGEHDEGHSETIELTEKQMTTVGVELGHFSLIPIGEGVTAYGELEANPQNIAEVSPMMAGIIKSLYVREGETVKAGARLAAVENLEIESLQNQWVEAQSAVKIAKDELNRQERLASHGAGVAKNLTRARIDYETAVRLLDNCRAKLKTAGVNPDNGAKENAGNIAYITAPISGIVTKIDFRIGSGVEPYQILMTISDPNGIYARLNVYEKDLNKIKEGDIVDLTLTNGGGKLKGTVEDIVRAIDSETKTVAVRIRLEEKGGSTLIPGMAVAGFISTGHERVTALPEEAVVNVEGKDCIFLLQEKEEHDGETAYVFKPIEVVKGNRSGGYVEIQTAEPLPEDARIVTAKAFYLASMASDHGEHNH